ncbi:RNA methyltransferase [Thalassoglobus sp. JC818]|uniref:TrmH family RNA methyltransferase n=1 Tax=Thalassoglobus sp. JC818 TaxID=3232136 RepID=UPI00345A3824
MQITSVNEIEDPRIAVYRHVKKTNLTRWSGQFIAEGQKVVERLLQSGLSVESILIREGKLALAEEWSKHNVPAFVIPDAMSRELLGYNFHAGVLACGLRPANPPLDELLSTDSNKCLILACPFLTNPENVGSIIRLARGFGVSGLIVGSQTSDPFSRRSIRVSMGNGFRIPIRESQSLLGDLNQLRQQWNFKILAAALSDDAIPLSDVRRPERCVLLLGNEDTGLEQEYLASADQIVTIPMQADADSLNVAMAAGIFVHHLCHS